MAESTNHSTSSSGLSSKSSPEKKARPEQLTVITGSGGNEQDKELQSKLARLLPDILGCNEAQMKNYVGVLLQPPTPVSHKDSLTSSRHHHEANKTNNNNKNISSSSQKQHQQPSVLSTTPPTTKSSHPPSNSSSKQAAPSATGDRKSLQNHHQPIQHRKIIAPSSSSSASQPPLVCKSATSSPNFGSSVATTIAQDNNAANQQGPQRSESQRQPDSKSSFSSKNNDKKSAELNLKLFGVPMLSESSDSDDSDSDDDAKNAVKPNALLTTMPPRSGPDAPPVTSLSLSEASSSSDSDDDGIATKSKTKPKTLNDQPSSGVSAMPNAVRKPAVAMAPTRVANRHVATAKPSQPQQQDNLMLSPPPKPVNNNNNSSAPRPQLDLMPGFGNNVDVTDIFDKMTLPSPLTQLMSPISGPGSKQPAMGQFSPVMAPAAIQDLHSAEGSSSKSTSSPAGKALMPPLPNLETLDQLMQVKPLLSPVISRSPSHHPHQASSHHTPLKVKLQSSSSPTLPKSSPSSSLLVSARPSNVNSSSTKNGAKVSKSTLLSDLSCSDDSDEDSDDDRGDEKKVVKDQEPNKEPSAKGQPQPTQRLSVSTSSESESEVKDQNKFVVEGVREFKQHTVAPKNEPPVKSIKAPVSDDDEDESEEEGEIESDDDDDDDCKNLIKPLITPKQASKSDALANGSGRLTDQSPPLPHLQPPPPCPLAEQAIKVAAGAPKPSPATTAKKPQQPPVDSSTLKKVAQSSSAQVTPQPTVAAKTSPSSVKAELTATSEQHSSSSRRQLHFGTDKNETSSAKKTDPASTTLKSSPNVILSGVVINNASSAPPPPTETTSQQTPANNDQAKPQHVPKVKRVNNSNSFSEGHNGNSAPPAVKSPPPPPTSTNQTSTAQPVQQVESKHGAKTSEHSTLPSSASNNVSVAGSTSTKKSKEKSKDKEKEKEKEKDRPSSSSSSKEQPLQEPKSSSKSKQASADQQQSSRSKNATTELNATPQSSSKTSSKDQQSSKSSSKSSEPKEPSSTSKSATSSSAQKRPATTTTTSTSEKPPADHSQSSSSASKKSRKEVSESSTTQPPATVSAIAKACQTNALELLRASRDSGFTVDGHSQTTWDLRAQFSTNKGIQVSSSSSSSSMNKSAPVSSTATLATAETQTDASLTGVGTLANAASAGDSAGSDQFGPSAPKQPRRETACVQPMVASMMKPASPAMLDASASPGSQAIGNNNSSASTANNAVNAPTVDPQSQLLRSKFTIKPKSSTAATSSAASALGSMSPFDDQPQLPMASTSQQLRPSALRQSSTVAMVDWRGHYTEQTLQSEKTYFERGRQSKRDADIEFPKQRNLDAFCIYLEAMLAFLLQVCAHEATHGGKAEAKRRSQLLTFIDEALSKCAPSAKDLNVDPRWDIPLALCHQSKAVLATRLYDMQSRDQLNSAASSIEKQLAQLLQQQQQQQSSSASATPAAKDSSPPGSVGSSSSATSSSSSAAVQQGNNKSSSKASTGSSSDHQKSLAHVAKSIEQVTQAFRLLDSAKTSWSRAEELIEKHKAFFERFLPTLTLKASLLDLSCYLDRCITEFRALRSATSLIDNNNNNNNNNNNASNNSSGKSSSAKSSSTLSKTSSSSNHQQQQQQQKQQQSSSNTLKAP